jgi:SPX domain protein involved in polyphosphate accumulation
MNDVNIGPKRFEKKWIFQNNNYLEILTSLYKSNFFFIDHHESRSINSIYFDSNKLDCINNNLDGVNKREKFRVRWYGNSKILNKPKLEIKIKRNLESHKKVFSIKGFDNLDIANDDNLKLLTEHINNKIISGGNLKPVNFINYQRLYLISSNQLIRATVDYNIRSKKIINFQNDFFANFNDVILELKYDINLDKYVRKNLNQMNVRYSKSSKYINYTLFAANSYS